MRLDLRYSVLAPQPRCLLLFARQPSQELVPSFIGRFSPDFDFVPPPQSVYSHKPEDVGHADPVDVNINSYFTLGKMR